MLSQEGETTLPILLHTIPINQLYLGTSAKLSYYVVSNLLDLVGISFGNFHQFYIPVFINQRHRLQRLKKLVFLRRLYFTSLRGKENLFRVSATHHFNTRYKSFLPSIITSKCVKWHHLSRSSGLLCAPRTVLAKNRDELIDFILLLLKDALRNPHQIANLLLLQLDIRVETGEVHLPLKGQLELLHITLIKRIVDGLISVGVRVDVPYGRVLREQLKDATELVLIGDICKHGGTGGVQVTDSGV